MNILQRKLIGTENENLKTLLIIYRKPESLMILMTQAKKPYLP